MFSQPNISLHVLENESNIQEEEGVEEAAGNIHVNGIDVHKRPQIKEFSIATLHNFIAQGHEQEAINYLKLYKPSDLMFFRGQSHVYEGISKAVEN